MASQEKQFHPKKALPGAISATLVAGGAGLTMSAVQNTLAKTNRGAFGVITRTGGTVGVWGELLPDHGASMANKQRSRDGRSVRVL